MDEKQQAGETNNSIKLLPGPRFRVALMVAMLADALQLIVFPFFIEGAESPADDVLDCGVAGVMMWLLGWHWEFLPSVLAKLVPASTWCRSGHWRLPMCIARRSGGRLPKERTARCQETDRLSLKL